MADAVPADALKEIEAMYGPGERSPDGKTVTWNIGGGVPGPDPVASPAGGFTPPPNPPPTQGAPIILPAPAPRQSPLVPVLLSLILGTEVLRLLLELLRLVARS